MTEIPVDEKCVVTVAKLAAWKACITQIAFVAQEILDIEDYALGDNYWKPTIEALRLKLAELERINGND